MIQAIGLTSLPRRHQLRPAVDDLTFEAAPGRVTVLLGSESSGKTTALRLMLQLQRGRGTALFRGRPVHRIQHLAREVGVLLSDVNGHPGRTARGHLRMLAAAAGVPVGRADEVLDVVGLSGLADQRMSTLSRGMERRLGMACALLGDPHTLVLDEPASELSPRETAWLYSLIRGYAQQGGTVLVTSHKSEEAAQLADRVVSIDSGRLVADQEAADFVRTRLRPRVAVRTPHAERLTAVLTQEGRKAGRDRDHGPLKVVREGGTKVSVYGSSCAEVGEWAHRNGILVHQLADERGDAGDAHAPAPLDRADGRRRAEPAHVEEAEEVDGDQSDGSPSPPATEQVRLEPEELEELEKFEEDASTAAPADADPDSSPLNTAVAAMSSGETTDSRPPSLSKFTEPEEKLGEAAAAEAEGYGSADDRPHSRPSSKAELTARPAAGPAAEFVPGSEADSAADPAHDLVPTGEPDPEPVLVTSSASTPSTATPVPTAPETTSAAAEAQTVRISDAPLEVSAADAAQKSDEAKTPVTSATNATTAPTGTRARALLKPLIDPDARPKPKSLWTPEPPAATAAAELPPQIHALPRPGPAAPLRYELCRLFSVRSTWIALAVTVASALCISLVMALTGMGLPSRSEGSPATAVRLLTGWPSAGVFFLPPAAVASGLLGAFAFGEEFRYPALAPARSPVPRRLSLLAAKLAVSASLAVLLSVAVAVVNAAGVTLFFGSQALALPTHVSSASPVPSLPGGGSWRLHIAAVFVFAAGCAWAGLLAAGIFRSGVVGTAVVVSVPLLLAPLAGTLLGDAPEGASASQSASHSASSSASGASAGGLPERLEAALLVPWPPGTERWVAAVLELVAQPVGCALALSLVALLTGYLVIAMNGRVR